VMGLLLYFLAMPLQYKYVLHDEGKKVDMSGCFIFYLSEESY
jgi:hypothetical protein